MTFRVTKVSAKVTRKPFIISPSSKEEMMTLHRHGFSADIADRSIHASPHLSGSSSILHTAPKKIYKVDHTPPQAMVGHCCDPRVLRSFREHLRDEFGITSYLPLVNAGAMYALPKTGDPRRGTFWEQLEFGIRKFKLNRTVLYAHGDCRWYHDILHPQAASHEVEHFILSDVKEAASQIHRSFTNMQVLVALATLNGEEITFELIEF